jgi:beta-ribofuranosylaminobenzene 5'-phosphate synthase
MTIRITAPSRLHFGLMNVPVPGQPNDGPRFGGLGLMVEKPGLTVTATEAEAWSFAGSLAKRAEAMVKAMPFARPYAIHADGPAEHVGLGIGTSLGMALAEIAVGPASDARLAEVAGRGLRSGIGVHGYRAGGFIIDHGKREGEALSRCESRPFPWPVVVIRPYRVTSLWHGEKERAAFAQPIPAQASELMQTCRDAVVTELASPGDFRKFAAGLSLFNALAGAPFAHVQGGAYSSLEASEVIAKIAQLKTGAVGQSSWGPTCFCVCENVADARRVKSMFSADAYETVVTTASAGRESLPSPLTPLPKGEVNQAKTHKTRP